MSHHCGMQVSCLVLRTFRLKENYGLRVLYYNVCMNKCTLLSHHPYCHTGSAAENDVTQTPGILWKHHGDSAEMNCSHTKDATYNQMYWYRQRQGETMSLVVFTTLGGREQFGDFNKSEYSTVKTEADKGSLTVTSVKSDDSGIYFCSVSEHSVADSIQS